MKESALLMAEYRRFSEMMWRNEATGEGRLKFLVTLATSVMTILTALWAGGDKLSIAMDRQRAMALTVGALVVLLLFGLISYLRALQRDHVTDEYKRHIDVIRKCMQTLESDLVAYRLEFRSSPARIWRGGLTTTFGAINILIASILGGLLLDYPAAIIGAAAGGILAAGVQRQLHRLSLSPACEPRQVPKPDRIVFRAGVGAVIYNSKGEVLCLERSDFPGSWQFPQGGIEPDDPSNESALLREIHEETGLTRNCFDAIVSVPLWMGYELPETSRSPKTGSGQVHHWYFLHLAVDSAAIKLKAGGEFSRWRWQPIATVAGEAVVFRRPVYQQLAEIGKTHGLLALH